MNNQTCPVIEQANKNKVHKIKIDYTVSEERLKDLFITAVEGGSNYWYQIESDTHGDYLKTMFTKGLEISNGRMYDKDHPEYVSEHISVETLLHGLKIMHDRYHHHWNYFMSENEDADTADVFLQCALFGEVIYG